MKCKWKGYVFMDVNQNLLNDTHDLGYGLTLRKASLDEVNDNDLKFALKFWAERRGSSGITNQMMPQDHDGNIVSGYPLQDPSDWRYVVIDCADENVFFGNVNAAFSLCDADLRMGFIKLEENGGSSPCIDFPMLNVRNALSDKFVDHVLPSSSDLHVIKQNISYFLDSVESGFPQELRSMLELFNSLDSLRDDSRLKILGYFSVIEGLLSHAPEPSDRIDSIQRQLIRNINLLNNRLSGIDRGIDFNAFGSTGMDKVLKKFYAFRSAIAHGGDVDKPLNDISKIINGGLEKHDRYLWVHDWLRNMTKRLLLASVVEPQLIMDLKG